ncbi:uncharacterized protein M6B38_351590 [Iris pallida]|uniref:Late embryogenesis abundant protein LEA-2 subgroup domain-containing protein n=1 Tax=Iris pallida TaxID=29817 RepID=A0AAX6GQG7_IRIPA|nr:uncharacterized protein M6B38_351590 [Iris pallida]
MSMADQQKIHPVDVEAARPPAPASASVPLVPRDLQRSDKGDPAEQYPPHHRTLPVAPLRPPKRRRSCFCKCCCWTLLSIILLIVLVFAAAGILYLVFDPKIPKYSIDRLRVSAFDIDMASFTARATFSVTVTSKNPNKRIGIYYEGGSRLSVLYSGTTLCSGSFPVFYQGHRNTSVVTVALTGEPQMGSSLLAALQQQQQTGNVPLEFRGDVPVRVKLGELKLRKVTSKVRCDLVVDSLSSNDLVSIKASNCEFKGLKL